MLDLPLRGAQMKQELLQSLSEHIISSWLPFAGISGMRLPTLDLPLPEQMKYEQLQSLESNPTLSLQSCANRPPDSVCHFLRVAQR